MFRFSRNQRIALFTCAAIMMFFISLDQLFAGKSVQAIVNLLIAGADAILAAKIYKRHIQ